VTELGILTVCGILFLFVYMRYLDRLAVRRIELDVPLREVLAIHIGLKQKFFAEALKLSDEEIDSSPELVRSIRIRVQIWKGHYSGDVAFYGNDEVALKQNEIYEFPTTSDQFPMALGQCPLLRKGADTDAESFDFGQGSPEKLEVLLSHKAVIVRAKDGRFGIRPAGPFFKSDLLDLVIPTREADLAQWVDTFGQDDPDWLSVAGRTRRYERDGIWVNWSISAVNPMALSWTTSFS
jgi:hypothetical protein